MADVALPQPTTGRSADRTARRTALWVVLTLVVAAAAMYVSGSFSSGAGANFLVIFTSLLVGAVPLVMLGALVAAIIGTFVPASAFERISRLPEPIQIPVAGLAGFAFPVCECGSVPVARRLVDRGLLPSAAVTFMLAAPILNPIVVLSTYVAYRGRDVMWPMVLGRAGLGFMAAMVVGWVLGSRNRDTFLRADRAHSDDCGCSDCGESCGCSHHHDHSEHSHSGHDHDPGSKLSSFFGYFAGDFAYMGRFLIIGAAVAALLQTAVPQSVLANVAGIPVLSLLAMMLLAFALSLCSESDAFVAASFVQFGVGSQLAFLVFGPMMDAKLAFLYRATFSKGFLRTVVAVVATVTLVGTLWIEVILG